MHQQNVGYMAMNLYKLLGIFDNRQIFDQTQQKMIDLLQKRIVSKIIGDQYNINKMIVDDIVQCPFSTKDYEFSLAVKNICALGHPVKKMSRIGINMFFNICKYREKAFETTEQN